MATSDVTSTTKPTAPVAIDWDAIRLAQRARLMALNERAMEAGGKYAGKMWTH